MALVEQILYHTDRPKPMLLCFYLRYQGINFEHKHYIHFIKLTFVFNGQIRAQIFEPTVKETPRVHGPSTSTQSTLVRNVL